MTEQTGSIVEGVSTGTTLMRMDLHEARVLQTQLVAARQAGVCGDMVLICEHPPVMTCGKRTSEAEEAAVRSTVDVPVVCVDRGGRVTYHGPGQVMLYPVVSLRERKLGVSGFVCAFLSAIGSYLKNRYSLATEVRTDEPGLWTAERTRRKLVAVGLHIRRGGVTDHGFCLNVSPERSRFASISPCGLEPGQITSLAEVLGPEQIGENSANSIASELALVLQESLGIGAVFSNKSLGNLIG
ncbi:MAG: lipoyl(octanoyl) transferase LipB, partial [Bdellovibrionales bacterium]|nr:lipoyl(octanoyl) transferase LipB [Bdellovibrionales bacterium]